MSRVIINNKKELLKRGTLGHDDLVVFGDLTYAVWPSWLDCTTHDNVEIFNRLGYDAAEVATEMYGYQSDDNADPRDWPECHRGDYDALTCLVEELYTKYEATLQVAPQIPGALTFAEMVTKVEGYPGKGVPYPRDDQEVQRRHRIVHAAMGLADEVGEITKQVKAYHQYGEPIDLGALAAELGDLKHFMQMMCNITGLEYYDLAPMNAHKIHTRYPGYDFSQHDAHEENRDRDAEQRVFAKYNGRTWS